MRHTFKKILIDRNSGKQFVVKDLNDNFHTSHGIVSKEDLNSNKTLIKSDKGRSFFLITPTFSDVWTNLHRGPQIMQQKEIGFIISKTGMNKDSVVVDAGGGSGSLCLSLANVCKHVTVYEVNPEHLDVVAKNVRVSGFDNIDLKQENVYKGIAEKNVDVITLDLPEPWQVIEHAQSALVNGGHLVVYLPNMTQVQEFVPSCKGSKINVIEVIELIERKWKVDGPVCRPEFQMLGHTGFLVFCRKF